MVGTTAGEQAAAGTTVGRGTAAAGRLGATGGLGGTAGRLSRGTGRGGSTTGFAGAAAGLGRTGGGAVAAAAAAAAGSGGGVGDHQADGDGTQDGEDRGKTHHEILLVENWTASQSIHIRIHRTRPRPAGRPRATILTSTLAGSGKFWVDEKIALAKLSQESCFFPAFRRGEAGRSDPLVP